MDNASFDRAGQELLKWSRVLVLTHDRPDGDAFGAIGAMKRILQAQGRHAEACLCQPVSSRYQFLADACGLATWPAKTADLQQVFDGVIVLDTCAWSQLGPAADFLRTTPLPKIVLDHHPTRDDLRGQSRELISIIDETAASACGLLYEWAAHMGWPLDAPAREAIFSGLATDTGWFRFPSTDGRTLRAAGELIDAGLRPDIMYARLYEGHRPARLRLLREALDTLRLVDKGTIAVMWLTRPMFLLSDALPSDSEDMVNEPLAVGSVVVSVLLSEMEGGLIRVNFRSRSPEIAGRDVDVSAIAQQFGGGGHRRAAGARIQGHLDDVREQVIQAVRSARGQV
jgi:phosphoesterase RecJ-like protein